MGPKETKGPVLDLEELHMTDNTDDEFDEAFGRKGKNRTPLVEEATEEIMAKYSFVTIEESDEIWYYKAGVYVIGGEILIGKELENIYGYELNTATLAQIIGHVKRRTYHKKEELDADINTINLKNGLYDINNNKLLEHTPAYLSIKQSPITYDANAKPKRFLKFLQEVLYARDILTAIDLIAYTFHRDYDIVEVLFVLLGYGRNGKTVLTSVLSSMHGLDNVSNVPLTQMQDNRFALSDLEGKNVNIDNELAGQTIKETAVLKRLTGGSRQPVRIERKNEKAYDAILYAKLVFCANKIPVSQDDSVAYHRRPVILSFPKTFDGEAEDPDLPKKLTTEQELSGIFNIAMRALRRIRKTKQLYVNERSVQERQEKYERATNPVRAFIKEAISEESTESHVCPKAYIYGMYNLYCSEHGLPFEGYQNFCKCMTNELDIIDTRPLINDERVQCWKGILLNPQYAPKTDQTRLEF
jgi:putative DNA primase/helicase